MSSEEGVQKITAPLKKVGWYIHQVMGDSAYDNYLEKHRRVHPDKKPLTKREFWRERDDFNEGNVQTGCC